MAYFFYTGPSPSYLTVIADDNKIKAASTESYEKYLTANRFGCAPDRADIGYVIYYSLTKGYLANINCLHYHSIFYKNKKKIITKDQFLKNDGLPSATICVPIIKESVAEIFKKYCKDKIQLVDVVITLQNGEEIREYKALNTVNRVEAFTWEGSEKKRSYEEDLAEHKEYLDKGLTWVPKETRVSLEKEKIAIFEKYGYPTISSMNMMAYKKEVVEREIICRDSVTELGATMICEALGKELKKHKFKGLKLYHEEVGRTKFV